MYIAGIEVSKVSGDDRHTPFQAFDVSMSLLGDGLKTREQQPGQIPAGLLPAPEWPKALPAFPPVN